MQVCEKTQIYHPFDNIPTLDNLHQDFSFNTYSQIMYLLNHPRASITCENETNYLDLFKKIQELGPSARVQRIEIKNSDIRVIPSNILSTMNTQTTRILKINNAQIKIISQGAFVGENQLNELSLKNNQIVTLGIFDLAYLEELDLTSNEISHIGEECFRKLPNLKRLFLKNNLITNLPSDAFQNLLRLTILDLAFNKLINIDNLVFNLKHLETLGLNNNRLKNLSDDFFIYNQKIKNIDLSDNYLKHLTELHLPETMDLFNCSNNLLESISLFKKNTFFVTLDLSNNNLSTLEILFSTLVPTKNFYFNSNKNGIDSQILYKSPDLETIHLDNNNLKLINRDLFQNNSNLKSLSLSQNYLSEIPNLPEKLQYLSINNNKIASFPHLIQLKQLNFLDMSHNSLTALKPQDFTNLKQLSELYLNHNLISWIEIENFKELGALQILNLSNNQLTALEIGVFIGLHLLKDLNLSGNKFQVLNEGVFYNLDNLQILSVSCTNLKYSNVANITTHLTNLKEIDLSGNYWSCALLVRFLMQFKSVSFKDAIDYHNSTNVKGVACDRRNPENEENYETVSKLYALLIPLIPVILFVIQLVFKRIYKSNEKPKGGLMQVCDKETKNNKEMEIISLSSL